MIINDHGPYQRQMILFVSPRTTKISLTPFAVGYREQRVVVDTTLLCVTFWTPRASMYLVSVMLTN